MQSLVIVESPAKAKTIAKYLGKNYAVEASIGHIRDLPSSAAEIPAQYKKEKWARLGVNVDNHFEPIYVVSKDRSAQIKKLKELLKGAQELYLATDEDREGEAISWHLVETLKPKVPIKRLVFHEITKSAIEEALLSPRQIDNDLVQAQETRRIIDRLYGYEVSPLLWKKVRPRLSAGRVQSVAVRLVVERERERIAFHNATYWDLVGTFHSAHSAASGKFTATLIAVGSKKIPSGKDFNTATGKLSKPDDFILLDGQDAERLAQRLLNGNAKVKSVEEKPYTERPYAPFTTSTLQQEANRKFGFTARTTMSVAQSLYENGYITYMRTDSTNLSGEAIKAARNHISKEYGKEYLPDNPRFYASKEKNSQEAHEAVRPAGSIFDLPETLRGKLSHDQWKLYDMIWKRTVACQMTDARGKRKTIIAEVEDAQFSVSGKTIDFAGYLRAYVEGYDDPEAELADRETILPDVKTGEPLKTEKLDPKSHTTQPPSRYSEAALTKTLTDKGIGRPSTYAAIIETILHRNYVFKKNGALIPTWTAFAVCKLLENYLPDLVNYDFTAQMEDQLDAVSRGELNYLEYLTEFYHGETGRDARKTLNRDASRSNPGLRKEIEHKAEEIDPREVSTIPIETPDGEEPVVVRIGKFGPFLQQGERNGSIPEELPPDELTYKKALELLSNTAKAEEPLGIDPDTGKNIYFKTGRFGPYIQLGENDDKEKKNAGLLKGMNPESVDFETALQLLSLPRTLGQKDGTDVIAANGKFGPYIFCGKETRSLPADISPLDVSLSKALELLAQPKYGAKRGAAKSKEPLKVFSVSPVTEKEVKVLSGFYGVYVTDGTTNATLPKGTAVEDLTFEQALNMLAEKAAKGPGKKFVRKKAAKKTAKKKK